MSLVVDVVLVSITVLIGLANVLQSIWRERKQSEFLARLAMATLRAKAGDFGALEELVKESSKDQKPSKSPEEGRQQESFPKEPCVFSTV